MLMDISAQPALCRQLQAEGPPSAHQKGPSPTLVGGRHRLAAAEGPGLVLGAQRRVVGALRQLCGGAWARRGRGVRARARVGVAPCNPGRVKAAEPRCHATATVQRTSLNTERTSLNTESTSLNTATRKLKHRKTAQKAGAPGAAAHSAPRRRCRPRWRVGRSRRMSCWRQTRRGRARSRRGSAWRCTAP